MHVKTNTISVRFPVFTRKAICAILAFYLEKRVRRFSVLGSPERERDRERERERERDEERQRGGERDRERARERERFFRFRIARETERETERAVFPF